MSLDAYPAKVHQGRPAIPADAWPTRDYDSFEASHVTLVASTDTTITFAQEVNFVRVINWDTANRVLVKDGAIPTNTDAAATRVGKAPVADVPLLRSLPFKTNSIHLRSAGSSEVTVEGYFYL